MLDALEWMVLIKEELGQDWLTSCRFRIGASSLLDNIINDINSTYDVNMTLKSKELEDFKNESDVEKSEKKVKLKKES